MSANCEYYQELMSRMLDGDLLDAETAALREHIRTCPECQALCAAFSSMTLSLREDEIEPPVSLVEGVMSRIRDYEAEFAFAQPVPSETPEPMPLLRASRSVHTRKKNRALRPALVAACLVLVIGAGALTTMAGRGGSAKSAAMEMAPAAAVYRTTSDSAVNETAGIMEEAAPEAAAPMALAEEAPAATAPMPDESAAAPMEEPQEAPMEEMAEAEAYSIQLAVEDGTPLTGFSLSSPAFVPEGSETAFDALISEGGTYPELDYQPFFYVEHNGVIYEFMTDENHEHLLWRDAAEGSPHLSQGSFDDLWAIFK